ncbi:hypothetical protein HK104_001193 [Borealophlyctis nickersoniae]|nr:hypothetical protein HK104_001193 [Borealophlyctis nickersoniae]
MSCKIFIGGLAWETDERSLRASFEKFGEIENARVITDRDTGRSRGFGFVTFTTPEHAKAAVEGLLARKCVAEVEVDTADTVAVTMIAALVVEEPTAAGPTVAAATGMMIAAMIGMQAVAPMTVLMTVRTGLIATVTALTVTVIVLTAVNARPTVVVKMAGSATTIEMGSMDFHEFAVLPCYKSIVRELN